MAPHNLKFKMFEGKELKILEVINKQSRKTKKPLPVFIFDREIDTNSKCIWNKGNFEYELKHCGKLHAKIIKLLDIHKDSDIK